MMWMVIVSALCVVLIGLRMTAVGKRRRAHRARQQRRESVRLQDAERERRRQAHYMSNFWNYDGSQQEEFEE